jgi:dynein heavy chain
LSFQWHYEFGLRPIKSVLVQAGKIKRAYPEMPEDEILMRALRDMNMPKFVFEDEPLFKRLLQDLFPGLRADAVGNEELKDNAATHLESELYGTREDKYLDDQVLKVVQLYETTSTRHTTMVVGPTGGGKSVIINTLATALEMGDGIKTKIDTLNAKSITLKELYGVLDKDSRDWTDGLLSKIYRHANVPPAPDADEQRNWILFDGDVDAIWIENMNSVMDDNRILTLDNGDRLKLQRHCILLFEVFDLQYASPATISRCGMVFIDPKNLGYKPFYTRWMDKRKKAYGAGAGETFAENFKELYAKYFPHVIDRIFEGYTGEEDLAEPL